MAEQRTNGTPSGKVQKDNTVDIRHRLPAPEYTEETSAEVAAPFTAPDYSKETSAEVAAPFTVNRPAANQQNTNTGNQAATGGAGMGLLAIALSILSLFVAPILFGAAGIILGFVARRRGAEGLGNWAIGIGAISIIVGVFILPFF